MKIFSRSRVNFPWESLGCVHKPLIDGINYLLELLLDDSGANHQRTPAIKCDELLPLISEFLRWAMTL